MNNSSKDSGILNLPRDLIDEARYLGKSIASEVHNKIKDLSTLSIERASLRMLGIRSANQEGTPWVNIFTEKCLSANLIENGALMILAQVCKITGKDPQQSTELVSEGKINLNDLIKVSNSEEIKMLCNEFATKAYENLKSKKKERVNFINTLSSGTKPYLYIIVATGNIYEDVKQAKSAALLGADIIAVIRTTAQSLLDYIPHGVTTEGFGGTAATQENFAVMREALDEVSQKTGRYIRLVNYCSGLAMPEIATLGLIEGLDIMVNDAIYGILFRDINSLRTLTDQEFSRRVLSFGDIIIVTGEDNLIKTVDAREMAHTVTTSQIINYYLALKSGLKPSLIGLGHAFEMDPSEDDSFLRELAQAWLVRDLFPKSPIKYMPPTRYITGNIFRAMVLNAAFNLIGMLTDQEILLLGMPTEALHTPYIQDRFLSLENALYFKNAASSLSGEFILKESSLIRKRAIEVLTNSVNLLKVINERGLFNALAEGTFASIKRPDNMGRGLDGVFVKGSSYYNPFLSLLPDNASDETEV